jgi:thymidylate synthase
MIAKEFKTTSEAYLFLLKAALDSYDHLVAPRGKAIRELRNVMFEVTTPSAKPIVTLDTNRNKTMAKYLAEEFQLYESASNKAADFAKASKFWAQVANPDGTINSAYGHLIFANRSCGDCDMEHANNQRAISEMPQAKQLLPDPAVLGYTAEAFSAGGIQNYMRTPWEWARRALLADKNTRQAIFPVMLPKHLYRGCRDVTCTICGNFHIRDDKLHLTMTMRSQDIVKGLAYDMPWFCHLLEKMRDGLANSDPTYATLLPGSYVHVVHSLHLYERDAETAKKMLG